MDLAACTEALRNRAATAPALGATLMFDCGADGVVYLDGRTEPAVVDNERRDADCTITITPENLSALMTGELEPTVGFMTGRFKVAGNMQVALKLQQLM